MADTWYNDANDETDEEGIEDLESFQELQPEADLHDTRTEHEFRQLHPDFFNEDNIETVEIQPFSPPDAVADLVNPHFEESPIYEVNCCDCARSFERSWRGHREQAAGNVRDGEPSSITEEWAGREMEPIGEVSDLQSVLEHGGPGSSAIVHSEWVDAEGDRHGHAFNVVNDGGQIRVVDSQIRYVFDIGDLQDGDRLTDAYSGGTFTALVWNSEGEVVHV